MAYSGWGGKSSQPTGYRGFGVAPEDDDERTAILEKQRVDRAEEEKKQAEKKEIERIETESREKAEQNIFQKVGGFLKEKVADIDARTTKSFYGTLSSMGKGIEGTGRDMQRDNDLIPKDSFAGKARAWLGKDVEKGGKEMSRMMNVEGERLGHEEDIIKEYDAPLVGEDGKFRWDLVRNPSFLTSKAFEGIYSTIPMLAAAATPAGLPATFSTAFLTEKGSAYEDYAQAIADKNGKKVDELSKEEIELADKYSNLYGLASGALEFLPVGMLVNKIGGGKVSKSMVRKWILDVPIDIVTQMVAEGGTEGLQQFTQNLIAKKTGIDPERNLTEGVPESTVTGMASGGGMMVGPSVMQGVQPQNINVVPEDGKAPEVNEEEELAKAAELQAEMGLEPVIDEQAETEIAEANMEELGIEPTEEISAGDQESTEFLEKFRMDASEKIDSLNESERDAIITDFKAISEKESQGQVPENFEYTQEMLEAVEKGKETKEDLASMLTYIEEAGKADVAKATLQAELKEIQFQKDVESLKEQSRLESEIDKREGEKARLRESLRNDLEKFRESTIAEKSEILQEASNPLNKAKFNELIKGQFNTVREVGGYKVRSRKWDNNSWQIVDNEVAVGDGAGFHDAPSIKEFRTGEELWNYIKENPKSKPLQEESKDRAKQKEGRNVYAKKDTKYGKKITKEKTTNKQAKDALQKLFGEANIEFVKNITTGKGRKALGRYANGMIQIMDGQVDPEATTYHEKVHEYLDLFLTKKEKADLLDAAKVQFGTDTLAETEEALAEEFIGYVRSGNSAETRTGFVGKVKEIFDTVILRIQSYFNNQAKLDLFFYQIGTGKALVTEFTPAKFREDANQELEKLTFKPEFLDTGMEANYKTFKDTYNNDFIADIEDADNLKKQSKLSPAKIDSMLYSQSLNENEVLEAFQDRSAKEVENRAEAKEIRAEIKEQKRVDSLPSKVAKKTKAETKEVQGEAIKDIEALSLKDRGKFLRTIRNIQTHKQLVAKSDKMLERIAKLQESEQKRELKAEIKNELASTKTISQSGKPKGKFTPFTQKVLDGARSVLGLSKADAKDKLMSNLLAHPEGRMPVETALENFMLERFSGMEELNTTGLTRILGEIIETKATGQASNALQKFNTESDLQRLKEFTVDRITDGTGIKEGSATFKKDESLKTKMAQSFNTMGKDMVFSWNGLINILESKTSVLGRKLVKKFNVMPQENLTKEYQEEMVEDISNAVSSAYGVKETSQWKINNKIADLSKPINLGTFENLDGVEGELVMSKDEVIKRWMEMKDKSLIKSLVKGNRMTVEMLRAIDKNMTEQDKAFARMQFDIYKKQYAKINAKYRIINGVDLPFNEFYSPIARNNYVQDTSKGFGSFIEDATHRTAVTNSSLKSRVDNFLPIKQQGSLDVLTRHLTETNYYAAWVEKIRELDSVFKDSTVTSAIEQELGSEMVRSIGDAINHLSTNGNKSAEKNKAIDFLRTRFTLGALMIKPLLAVKQMVSTFAYLEKVGPVEFTAGVVDFWKNPIKNMRILNAESTLIRTRGANMERDINDMVKSQGGKLRNMSSISNMLMANIKIGDKGAILTGSWALRRARLKQRVAIGDIVNEYENFSADTQQSADTSRLSAVQKAGSFVKLFTMFMSSQRGYLAKETEAVKSLLQKDGTSKENLKRVARVMFIYHILLPVMFQVIANGGGFKEDDRKDYLRAALIGSLNGLLIFKDMIDTVVRVALGQKVWDSEVAISGLTDDIEKAYREVDGEDVTAEDWMNALGEVYEIGNKFGVPVTQAKGIYGGLVDIANKDYAEGIARVAGYSEYRSEKRFKKDTELEKQYNEYKDEKKEEKDATNKLIEEIKKDGITTEESDQLNQMVADKRITKQSLKGKLERDLTDEEKMLDKFQVGDGSRAKAISKIMKDMSKDERNEYKTKLEEVGLYSVTVHNQVVKLLQ